MPWFKVDDGFWAHPKCVATPPIALALWVRAGSWSAQQLTDGNVPTVVLAMLGGTSKLAAALVNAGLWETTSEGWRFHDWHTYQPTRAQVAADREASAARVAEYRRRRRAERATSTGSLAAVPDE